MLTAKEAQLGTLMARIAALGTIVIFAVQALLIGPDQVGYSEQYGAIVDIVSFIQSFGILFTISLTQKLFGDNNPYFRIVSAILFVAAVIQLTGSLSSTGNANSVFESVLSTDQVNSVANVGQLVTFILFGIWALCLISADENNLVPSWGRISGQGAAYLVIAVQIGSLFGLIPLSAFVPVFILGGVILFPVFVFGISVAFSSSGN
ncbi:hypothetical protein N9U41_00810 [Acidimicrobiaceae bacterium]|nr:hypothetical protein [Acidimicrobiaceae bacterium]GIS38632.1 MAG: hypothetical protein Ct9H90mP10_10330 [Actinomycetota bacterium]